MNRKKVLLLNPPGSQKYLRDLYCNSVSKGKYFYQPIDILCLSALLYPHFDIHIIDALVDALDPKMTLEKIKSIKPDYIIFLSSSSSWKEDFKFMLNVSKILPQCEIIGNGSYMLIKGKDVLEENLFMSGVLLSFLTDDVITYLKRDPDSNNIIENIIYKTKDGQIVEGKNTGPAKGFKIGMPRHELLSIDKYRSFQTERSPFTSILASIGCPFGCNFCNYNGVSYAVRDIKDIIEELKYIQLLGIKEVYFRDYTFGINKIHSIDLCNAMIENGLDITWFCLSRVDVLNDNLVKIMKRAGCHTIQLGVESGDDEVLKRSKKGFTVKDIKNGFSLCHKYGIKTVGYFMFGWPGEDEESAKKTINVAKEIDCDYGAFSVTTPYEGTELRHEALDSGWVDYDAEVLEGAVSFPVMKTDMLSKEEIWKLRNRAIREFYLRPSYIWKKVKSIKSLSDIQILMREGNSILSSLIR